MKSITTALTNEIRPHVDLLAELEAISPPAGFDNSALPSDWEADCVLETFMTNRACLRITGLEPFVSLDRFGYDDEGLYAIEENGLHSDGSIHSLDTLLH